METSILRIDLILFDDHIFDRNIDIYTSLKSNIPSKERGQELNLKLIFCRLSFPFIECLDTFKYRRNTQELTLVSDGGF